MPCVGQSQELVIEPSASEEIPGPNFKTQIRRLKRCQKPRRKSCKRRSRYYVWNGRAVPTLQGPKNFPYRGENSNRSSGSGEVRRGTTQVSKEDLELELELAEKSTADIRQKISAFKEL